ncbi:MAG: hypothetical protein NTX40_07825 [Planctomycetota bacterium]|nr:hypothetical protein [Planctomycetota bacterium]
MMEFVKRHAFLLALGAGFVVIAAAVLVTVQFGYRGPSSALEAKLARTEGAARNLLGSPLYGQKLIEQMSAEVKQREARYEEILDYLRKLGQARKPLVEGLFPRSTDVNLRHSFKAEYDPALDRFMKTLGAILPLLPQDTPEAEKAGRLKKFEQATMFAHPQQSFVRPDWVDKAEAPMLDQCAVAQEDLWLMSDLVGILAEINRDSLAVPPPVIRNVPIKELVEIRIGAGVATLEGSKGGTGGARYLPSSAPAGVSGAPTVSGRLSKPGFYLVLPFRLVVVIESRWSGELLRRLKGTESFLSVEAWHMKPIVPEAFERFRGSLLASSREVYGNGGVVLLEVVGESLVFQFAGGRVTNPPQTAAGPEAPAQAG